MSGWEINKKGPVFFRISDGWPLLLMHVAFWPELEVQSSKFIDA
jgi:hypothetical protein